jgi:hypothetical protein
VAAGYLPRRFGNSARLALALVKPAVPSRNDTHGVVVVVVVDSRLREIDDRIRHFFEILQRDAAPYSRRGHFNTTSPGRTRRMR